MTSRDEALMEETFDRWVDGDLDAVDEGRALAMRDPVFALELELMESGAPALDEPLDRADQAMVDRTLSRVLSTHEATRRAPRRVFPAVLFAAALLVGSGWAAAEYWSRTNAPESPAPGPTSPTSPRSPPASRAPTPAVPLEVGVEATPSGGPVAAPMQPDSAEEPRPPEAPAATAEALTAQELFERAGHARAEGNPRAAARRYRQLQARYPQSSEALTSRLSLARLLASPLHDPRAALVQLDAYLRRAPNGTLAPECRYQRAVVLRRLGRTDAEREALRESLRRDPGSVYATTVRSRLEVLGAAGD